MYKRWSSSIRHSCTFPGSSSSEADGVGRLDKKGQPRMYLLREDKNVSYSPLWPRFSQPAWGFEPLTFGSEEHFF